MDNDQGLATYAIPESGMLGRKHDEPTPMAMSAFELDHKRVLNCSAFRRLQYKTQVFVTQQGDHFRTRLTHTLEVASVARSLARGLRANALLAEVIALAHDLGHPPYGHAGEAALDSMMAEHGGYEHNAQSLRVVEYLEHPIPPFRGLNLTVEVREGLATHHTAYDKPSGVASTDETLMELVNTSKQASIEAQVAGVADRIAYDCHDLEDALAARLIDASDLDEIELWRDVAAGLEPAWKSKPLFSIRRVILEALQQRLIEDATCSTKQHIEQSRVSSVSDVRSSDQPVVRFSRDMGTHLDQLEQQLRRKVYGHGSLKRMDAMAAEMIGALFRAYLNEPDKLPQRYLARVAEQGLERVICDYVAGMTDRFCESEYRKIYLPFSQPPGSGK